MGASPFSMFLVFHFFPVGLGFVRPGRSFVGLD